MKNSLLTLCICMVLCTLFNACSDDVITGNSLIDSESNQSQYAISQEEALANLDAFISAESSSSRSARPAIKSVRALKFRQSISRGADNIECDNLLYVANFENEGGFAILAGDKRIPEEVIAISEQGNISDDAILRAASNGSEDDGDNAYYPEYPATGPGFFSYEAYPDELVLNPNTINLYTEVEGDTLICNFKRYTHVKGVTIDAPGPSSAPGSEFVVSACQSYAEQSVRRNTPGNYIIPERRELDPFEPGPVSETTTYGPWEVAETTGNFLSKYEFWGQDAPFNSRVPIFHPYKDSDDVEYGPVGCSNLAIAKLMAYFATPSNYTAVVGRRRKVIDWIALDQYKYFPGGVLFDSEMAAALLSSIGRSTHSKYSFGGTGTSLKNARNFMRQNGFANAKDKKYNFEIVKAMLTNGCPIYIRATSKKPKSSHAWNIDGYKIKERVKTVTKNDGENIYKTTSKEQSIMVHCDFGAYGSYNGYYVNGIFNLTSEDIEYDYGPGDDKYNYSKDIKVIVYDKPI